MAQGSRGVSRAVLAAALGSAGIVGHLVVSKAARDALFLSTFDVSRLPQMTIAAAVASLVSALITARAITRFGPGPLLSVVLVSSALLHGGEWSLLKASPGAAAILLYVHVGLFGAPTLSAFWSLVNEAFDPHTAKRAVARITMGGTLGGAAGGILAWQVGGVTGVPALLVLLALLDVATVAAVPQITRGQRAAVPSERSTEESGLALLAKVPYLRQLALVVGLSAMASALLDYVIGARAVAELEPGADLVAFFSLFHASVGLGAFVVQLVATRAVLQRFGLAVAVGLLPASILGFGAIALWLPRLWSAVLLRGFEGIVSSSLYRAGYELGYTPLPPAQKRPTKTLIDVGIDRVGAMLGGGIALAVVAFWAADSVQVATAVAMGAAALTLFAALRLHAGYVSALARSLESGAVRLSENELVDATTRRTLAETAALDRRALLAEIERRRDKSRSDDEAGRDGADVAADPLLARAADLRSANVTRMQRALATPLPVELVPFALDLLADDRLSHRALESLREVAPRASGLLIDTLLDEDKSSVLRRRIPRVLEIVPSERVIAGLVEVLGSESPDVRQQAALALARMREQHPALELPQRRIVSAAARELERLSEEQRPSATERGVERLVALLSVVLEREPLRLAHRALYGPDEALRGTALEYLENVLPEEIRVSAMNVFSRARQSGPGRLEPAPPSLRRRERRELVAELMKSREFLLDVKALSDKSELA